jgi:ribose 5-phosphate isomerase B
VDFGILICGSGLGMSIAANKFAGIRAAHVESTYTAQLAAEHNQANVLCIGERITAAPYALAMVKAWMSAEFGGTKSTDDVKSRHQARIDKISALEKK